MLEIQNFIRNVPRFLLSGHLLHIERNWHQNNLGWTFRVAHLGTLNWIWTDTCCDCIKHTTKWLSVNLENITLASGDLTPSWRLCDVVQCYGAVEVTRSWWWFKGDLQPFCQEKAGEDNTSETGKWGFEYLPQLKERKRWGIAWNPHLHLRRGRYPAVRDLKVTSWLCWLTTHLLTLAPQYSGEERNCV